MANDTFLPEDYIAPSTGYMKLLDGDNIFRVLSSAVTGYEYWTTEKQPIRSKVSFTETPNIKIGKDGKPEPIKHFWAFIVWNYATKAVEILEITQKGIRGSIQNLVSDEDWGNPKNYDIKVKKTGAGMDTEYAISPKPQKEVAPEVLTALAEKPINLEALFTGGNPFEIAK